MPFLGLSHLDEFLGSQPLLSLGFLHGRAAAKTLTRPKQSASNIPSLEAPLEITQSKPSSKLDHPGQGARHLAQLGLEFLQQRQLQNSLGSHRTDAPLIHPHSSTPMSFLLWGAQNWAQHSHWSLTSAGQRGMITSFDFPPRVFLMQPRMLLGLSGNIDAYRYNRILRTWWVTYFQGLLYIREIQTILFC